MSKFTTEVRYICEMYAGKDESVGYNDVEEVLNDSYDKVFSFEYPIFDENYRKTLEKKILKHYYTREISEESVGLWKLKLDARMNEIMPYYNQLYSSEVLEFNPFYDFNVSTIRNTGSQEKQKDDRNRTDNENGFRNEVEKGKISGYKSGFGSENNEHNVDSDVDKDFNGGNISNKETSKNNEIDSNENRTNVNNEINHNVGKNVDKYSDTPQGAITQMDVATDAYLTNARIIDNNDDNNSYNAGSENSNVNTSEAGKENETVNQSKFENEHENKNEKINENKIKTLYENKDEENDLNRDVVDGKIRNRNEVRNKSAENITQYIENVIGKKSGITYSKMLIEFRETFLNIDAMIIEELRDLFFGLWE